MQRGYVLLVWVCFVLSVSGFIFSLFTGITVLSALQSLKMQPPVAPVASPEELEIQRELVKTLKANGEITKALLSRKMLP